MEHDGRHYTLDEIESLLVQTFNSLLNSGYSGRVVYGISACVIGTGNIFAVLSGSKREMRGLLRCIRRTPKEHQWLAKLAIHFLFMRHLKIHYTRMLQPGLGITFDPFHTTGETYSIRHLCVRMRRTERSDQFYTSLDSLPGFRYSLEVDGHTSRGLSYYIDASQANDVWDLFLLHKYEGKIIAFCMGSCSEDSIVRHLDELLLFTIVTYVREKYRLDELDYRWVNTLVDRTVETE